MNVNTEFNKDYQDALIKQLIKEDARGVNFDYITLVEEHIKGLLVAEAPCTFDQIVRHLIIQCPGVTVDNAVMIAILAIAQMFYDNTIYRTEIEGMQDPMEYAWEL